MNNFKSFLAEETQILSELKGYHQYENMDFFEIIEKIKEENGHRWSSGSLGVVFIPKDKDYVYKCWVTDVGYSKFLDIAEAHQNNPFFPKLLSKRKKLEAFFKRPASFDQDVSIIKMEKLLPIRTDGTQLTRQLMELIDQVKYVQADKLTLKWLEDQVVSPRSIGQAKSLLGRSIDKHAKGKISLERFNDDYVEAMKDLRKLALTKKRVQPFIPAVYEAMSLILESIKTNNLVCDMHSENFMVRPNGELVITDPFVSYGWREGTLMNNLKVYSSEDHKTGRSSKSSSSEKKEEEKPLKLAGKNHAKKHASQAHQAKADHARPGGPGRTT